MSETTWGEASDRAIAGLRDQEARRDRLAEREAAVADPTPATCRTTRRCPIADDPCGPGGPRPYCWETASPTPEEVYRAAAEANDLVRPGRITQFTDVLAASPDFRAAVDAVLAIERERIVTGVRNLTAGDPVTADEVAEVVRGGTHAQ